MTTQAVEAMTCRPERALTSPLKAVTIAAVSSPHPPVWLDADAVRAACRPAAAVEALTTALVAGLDPGQDPARSALPLAAGQLLLMPAERRPTATGPGAVGVKVLTLGGPGHDPDLPLVQGLYLLFEGGTLAPAAVLDGAALTTLRTPAVSVAAVRSRLLAQQGPLRVVVLGAGPQGTGHVQTLHDAVALADRHRPLESVRYVVREPARVRLPPPCAPDTAVLTAGSAETDRALAAADVVVCATSSGEPLFRSDLLREDVVVVAVGSHDPGRRELDSALLSRAAVVVEDTPTALREAGDVVLALADGALAAGDLLTLREVVGAGRPLPLDRPVVFKSVGMAWQDLVVAQAVLAGYDAGSAVQRSTR